MQDHGISRLRRGPAAFEDRGSRVAQGLGLDIEESHLLADPLDRVATFGNSQFFKCFSSASRCARRARYPVVFALIVFYHFDQKQAIDKYCGGLACAYFE
jgi:hypothetical protein